MIKEVLDWMEKYLGTADALAVSRGRPDACFAGRPSGSTLRFLRRTCLRHVATMTMEAFWSAFSSSACRVRSIALLCSHLRSDFVEPTRDNHQGRPIRAAEVFDEEEAGPIHRDVIVSGDFDVILPC